MTAKELYNSMGVTKRTTIRTAWIELNDEPQDYRSIDIDTAQKLLEKLAETAPESWDSFFFDVIDSSISI